MSTETLHFVEHAKRVPTLKTVDRIASALKLDTGSLFSKTLAVRIEGQESIERILGLNVAEQRRLLNWSQEKLSEASGIGRSDIARIELGQQNPTIDTLARLAIGLNTSIESMLSLSK